MDNSQRRVVITGMAINTPIGDSLDSFYDNLVAGRSAITRWKYIDTSRCYSKVGGDLSEYDVQGKVAELKDRLPGEKHKHMRKLVKKAPKVGKILGTVTDKAGSPLAAEITVEGPEKRTFKAGTDGAFKATLKPGAYKIKAAAAGYFTRYNAFVINAGAKQALSFKLTKRPKRAVVIVLKRSLRWQGRGFAKEVFETAGFFTSPCGAGTACDKAS